MHISDLPPFKRILNTSYTVDFFKSQVEGVSHYFLSHFHADHYIGLTKSFPFEIYCSQTTSNLLSLKFKVKTKPLEMFKVYKLKDNDTVMCIEANHCPGAVCFIFNIQNYDDYDENDHNNHFDNHILHTGDFRFTKLFMHQISKLKFSTVFLDNTYEGFKPFPSQFHSIKRVINVINNLISKPCLFPINYVFIFCTYSVGKEKVCVCAAEFFNKSLRVTKEKMKIYECFDEYTKNKINGEVKEMVKGMGIEKNEVRSYFKGMSKGMVESEDLRMDKGLEKAYPTPYPTPTKSTPIKPFHNPTPLSRITTQDLPDQFLIISTTQVDKNKLNKLLKGIKGNKAIVFCGTGWKDSIKYFDWVKEDGRVIKKGIEIHYIPYSEHSSSEELKKFKEEVEYERIMNTVKNKEECYLMDL